MINRRSLITGLISLVAAPAIVRAGSLMPVRNYAATGGLITLPNFKGENLASLLTPCPYPSFRVTLEEFSPQNLKMFLMGEDDGQD